MIIFVGAGCIEPIEIPSIKNYFSTIGDRTRIVTAVAQCFSRLRHPLQNTSFTFFNVLPLHLLHVRKNCIIKKIYVYLDAIDE